MNVIFFEKENWGKEIKRTSEEYLHIVKILKLKEGDTLKVGIINLGKGEATIQKISENAIYLKFPEQVYEDKKQLDLNIFLAYTRPIVLKRIFKNCGVFSIKNLILYKGELSEKSYVESSIIEKEKYEYYFKQGLNLSKSSFMPNLIIKPSLEEALLGVEAKESIYLDESGTNLYKSLLLEEKIKNIFIGSERGFVLRELNLFEKNKIKGAKIINRTLSTELCCELAMGMFSCFNEL